MVDSTTRGAARVAALAALPVAVLVGIVTFWWLGNLGADGAPEPGRPRSTAPVTMPAAALADPAATTCRDLVGKLPAALRTEPRRPVTAGADQNAAYGDPAITLACGAPAPSIPAGAEVFVLSGVCWLSTPTGDGTAWITVDRATPVRVTVPKSYDAPGQWVIEFSAPITAAVPAAARFPSGC
jgi:Protein of unknown function (DUF3515)